MNNNFLGENVKRYREEKEWSIRELERQSGVSKTLISFMESGKRTEFSYETINKLAAAFSVSANELLSVNSEGSFEVNDFFESIEVILSSDDVCIDGQFLSKKEKEKILEYTKDLEYLIIKRRELRMKEAMKKNEGKE